MPKYTKNDILSIVLLLEIAALATILVFFAAIVMISQPSNYKYADARESKQMIISDKIHQEPVQEILPDTDNVESSDETSSKEESSTYNTDEYYGDEYGDYDIAYESSNTNGLTKSGGINYYNGRTETYYSSRVLRHYMTDQWYVDDNGVYHDMDGYVVVASSDLPYGSITECSFGTAKVYDSGCASGILDIYVNW